MSTPTNERTSAMWFLTATAILMLFGLFFIFSGLRVFSDAVPLIPHEVLLPWTSALYGTIMVGWGVTPFFVGHIAFRRNRPHR